MRESILCIVLLLAGLACTAHGHEYQQPPQQYAIVGYQPVIQPGQWVIVQRPARLGGFVPNTLTLVEWVFGPQMVFIPQQPQYQQPPR